MKAHPPLLVLAALAIFTGCESVPKSRGVELSKVLQGPYELRLTLDRAAAAPGETVIATVEFENTGGQTLWIPRQREIFFGFAQDIGTFSTSSETWQSSCDGLEFVPVRPGKSVRYEKGFPAPAMAAGEIRVYVTANRNVTVPLLIKAYGALPGT